MGWFNRLSRSVWRRDRLATDVNDELQFHIDERTRDNIASGMSPEEARRDAVRRFGNAAHLQEETRDIDVVGWLDGLVRESGQALRTLTRRPGLAVTAILSLMLGIGATSAMFSVVDAVLLKPLALPDPASLIALEEFRGEEPVRDGPARLRDWRGQATSFRSLAGYYEAGETLTERGLPQRVRAIRTFGPFVATLGVRPVAGRSFTVDEEAGLGTPVLLLSDRFRRRLGEARDWVGQSLMLSGEAYTIIGVLPRTLDYPPEVDVISPASLQFQAMDRRARFVAVVGRLKDGASIETATPEVETIASRLATQYPATDSGIRVRVVPLHGTLTEAAREPLTLLLGAVFLVLLIACVNIASLLLARAAERRHEAAIRTALGAGRGGLVRMYLFEGAWLALAGGAAGLALAPFGVVLLQRALPADLPRLAAATLDWRVTAFAALVAIGSGLVFAVAPALHGSRPAGARESIRHGGRATATAGRLLVRRGLVVAQVTLSMILLVGAGLLARSVYLMRASSLGIAPEQVLAIRVPLTWEIGSDEMDRFYTRALDALAAIPGVRAAGLADRLPLEGGTQRRSMRLLADATPEARRLEGQSVSYRATSLGYFSAVGVPLVKGRLWRERRGAEGPRELVVNATFARRYLPAERPLGARITFDAEPKTGEQPRWYDVVGVVGDVRQTANQTDQLPEVFVPYHDTYWPLSVFVIRGTGNPRDLSAAARHAIASVDPNRVIDGIRPLESELAAVTAGSRTRAAMVALFAVTALVLAAIGLYGVLSSEVAQRGREIGVRIALGAHPGQVLRMVVQSGLVVTALGLGLGAAGAFALGSVLASQLYGIRATDITSFAGAAAALALVATLASYVPARRAARVDPMTALRRE